MRRLVRANYTEDEIKTFKGVRDLVTSRNFRVLIGHSVYGMHHFAAGEFRYFTMLRDPVARAISHYFFIKQPGWKPNTHNAAQKVLHNAVPLKDIFDATAKTKRRLMGTWLVDNMQTRYLAGFPHYWRGKASSQLLKAAKHNLRHRYVTFGLQDEFDASLEQIAGALNWTIGPEGGEVRPKATRISKTVDQDDIEAVERFNRLDSELYDYAKELFRQRRTDPI